MRLPAFINSTVAFGLVVVCQTLVADDVIPVEQISPIQLTLKLATEIADPSYRARSLLEIAEAQLLANDQQKALATLNRAVSDLASSSESVSTRKDPLVKAAGLIAKAGDIERALEIIDDLRPGKSRYALGTIAYRLAADGDVNAAIQVAEADSMHRRYVLTRIIVSLSREGKVTNALSLVQQLKDADSWDQRREAIVNTTVRIAIETEDLELLDQAVQVLPEFESTHRMLVARGEIGNGAARVGNAKLCQELFGKSREVIGVVRNPIWRITLYLQMAEGLLTLGKLRDAITAIDDAMEAAEELNYAATRETVIVRTLHQAGELFAKHEYQNESLDFLERARRRARQITKPWDRVRSYQEMASVCVSLGAEEHLAGLFSEAMHSVENSENRLQLENSVRRNFAIAWAELGQSDEVFELLPTLPPSMRTGCLDRLVYFLVQHGRDDAAIDAVLRFESSELRDQTLANLASRLGKKRRLKKALQAIEEIKEPGSKDLARDLCAVSLAEAGAAKDGFRVARLIESRTRLQFVMNRLAEIATESGDLESATLLVSEYPKLIEKRGLALCVRLLASAGRFEQAIEAAQKCGDASCRSRALFNIAFMQASEPVSIANQGTEATAPRRMKEAFATNQAETVERLGKLSN